MRKMTVNGLQLVPCSIKTGLMSAPFTEKKGWLVSTYTYFCVNSCEMGFFFPLPPEPISQTKLAQRNGALVKATVVPFW